MFASDKEASPAKDDGRSSPLEKHKHQDRPRAKVQRANDYARRVSVSLFLLPVDFGAYRDSTQCFVGLVSAEGIEPSTY
jgi:hypothetical protein